MSAPSVPVFQLLQWKYAIRLEAKGLRHSSGRSVRAHAARVLGCKRGEAAARIEDLLDAAPMPSPGLCGRCGRGGAAGAAGLCSTCYNLPEDDEVTR